MLRRLMFVLASTIVMDLDGATPRVALTYFEKDLQAMTKASAPIVLKQGSFVERLASKRQQKEEIEATCAALQLEVDVLTQEIAQLKQTNEGLDPSIQLTRNAIDQYEQATQHVAEQCDRERESLQTVRLE